MKTGVNSVLWGGHSLADAFAGAATAGYDGIELSAIPNMSEHLVLDRWAELVGPIRELSESYGLDLLAIEQPSQDPEVMEQAFQAAQALAIPIVNCGPGGKTGDEGSLRAAIESLAKLARRAEDHGVTLCVKAHVGAAICDTPTSLRVLEAVDSPAFGMDMDPSHIHRAGEDAVEALRAVVSRAATSTSETARASRRLRARRRTRPTAGAISTCWATWRCFRKPAIRARWTSRS